MRNLPAPTFRLRKSGKSYSGYLGGSELHLASQELYVLQLFTCNNRGSGDSGRRRTAPFRKQNFIQTALDGSQVPTYPGQICGIL